MKKMTDEQLFQWIEETIARRMENTGEDRATACDHIREYFEKCLPEKREEK